VSFHQGDQIGRNFSLWAIAYFGQCFENYRSSKKNLASFFARFQHRINFSKIRVGLHFG
jgi:hypothetical protein